MNAIGQLLQAIRAKDLNGVTVSPSAAFLNYFTASVFSWRVSLAGRLLDVKLPAVSTGDYGHRGGETGDTHFLGQFGEGCAVDSTHVGTAARRVRMAGDRLGLVGDPGPDPFETNLRRCYACRCKFLYRVARKLASSLQTQIRSLPPTLQLDPGSTTFRRLRIDSRSKAGRFHRPDTWSRIGTD